MTTSSIPKNFAMTGVAGFVAPRHLKAIADTGNRLVAAVDPHDAVGVLDRYSFDVRFFTEFERFDRHLEKLRRGPEQERVHYVSVCSPNYLHDAHMRLALRVGADAICEKPLVINPWNLDGLQELEAGDRAAGSTPCCSCGCTRRSSRFASGSRAQPAKRHDVQLTYLTARGRWYDVSWKGVDERSGGIVTNIGIHFFDLLRVAVRAGAERARSTCARRSAPAGTLVLANADVRWYPVGRSGRPAVRAGARQADDVPIDHGGRRATRVQRRLHRPPHARLRRDAAGPRLRRSPTPGRRSS